MKIFMTIVTYVLYFFFYSAVGWLGESIYCSVGARKWVNRGFLKGPMCPIYGTGALAMAITLTPVKNLDIRVPMFGHDVLITPLLVFIAGMVVCDIVEFITSVLMEKLFHARWWDYSNKKFNIQGHLPRAHVLLGHSLAALPLSRPSDSRTVLLAAARLRGDNHLRLRACDILS